jgi:hypothetical protein
MTGSFECYSEQVNALNNYGKATAGPFLETYNLNWQNHPNFSWRQNQPLMNIGRQHVHQQNQFRSPIQSYPHAPQSTPPQFMAQPRKQSSL